jgi:hypothetical protein
MRLSSADLRQLAIPLVIAAALLAAGAGLIWGAQQAFLSAQRVAAGAQAERQRNTERLARIAEEEREVREKIDVYQRLKALNIIGEERRLEWADAMTRIRKQRELLDVRYRVERQRLLLSTPGKPGNVDFFASTMRVELALLHEEDLLRFLTDLRNSGNAFYSVRSCALTRSGAAAGAAASAMASRLRGECSIDLITIVDRGAKG